MASVEESTPKLDTNTLQSIASLTGQAAKPFNHAVVRGIVTYFNPPMIYIQDQTGAIPVFGPGSPPLSLGDEVEASGDLIAYGDHHAISNVFVRRLWSGSQPVPLALQPEQAAEGAYDGELIEVEGRLLKKQIDQSGIVFLLEAAHQIFTVKMESSLEGSEIVSRRFETGSVLRLTGICSQNASSRPSYAGGFTVLIRSADDVRLIHAAPWWNGRTAMWMFFALLASLSLLHRLRVHFLKLRFKAIIDERSRLAREMHDTVAQGFSGVALQLENVAHDLGQAGVAPTLLARLQLAIRTVRHSRDEARNSIFALRSLKPGNLNLLCALTDSAEMMSGSCAPNILTTLAGEPFLLPEDTAQNLLRVGQEAIANALRHSMARSLHIWLEYTNTATILAISDDGAGFQIEDAGSVAAGHFGIFGMKERTSRMAGSLTIKSAKGQGTEVRVQVPRYNSANPRIARLAAHFSHWRS